MRTLSNIETAVLAAVIVAFGFITEKANYFTYRMAVGA